MGKFSSLTGKKKKSGSITSQSGFPANITIGHNLQARHEGSFECYSDNEFDDVDDFHTYHEQPG